MQIDLLDIDDKETRKAATGRVRNQNKALQQVTDEEIIETLKKCRGLLYLAANILGVPHATLAYRINNTPELLESMKDQRGKTLDLAEAKLMQAVDKGEQWAITMLLRTLGRERGYVERQEVSNVTTVKLQIVEEIVDADSKQIEVKVTPAVEYKPSNLPEGFNDASEAERVAVEFDEA